MADGIASGQPASVPGGPGGGGLLAQAGMSANPLAQAAFQRMQPSAPGPGAQAGAMRKIGLALASIQEAMTSLPIGSELHTSVLKAVRDLSRHFGQDAQQAGPQQTDLQDQMRMLAQRALMQRVMQNSGGAPAGPVSTPSPGA
jgi:hypothetical protein